MAGVAGIEPASVVLETIILPLYYTPKLTAKIYYHISNKLAIPKFTFQMNIHLFPSYRISKYSLQRSSLIGIG